MELHKMAECLVHNKAAPVSCELCKLKNEQNTATAFCVQCQDYMCFKCSEYHYVSKPTKHHRILEKNEMLQRKASTSTPEFCNEHGGESSHFFCQAHNCLVCCLCRQFQHLNCKNVIALTEFTKDIENSDMYQNTLTELNQVVFLLRKQKASFLKKYQKISGSTESPRRKQSAKENGSETENLVNSQKEHAYKLCERTKAMIHDLESCDNEIQQVEKLAEDLILLKESKQQTQLFIAIRNSQLQTERIRSTLGKLVRKTDISYERHSFDTHVVRITPTRSHVTVRGQQTVLNYVIYFDSKIFICYVLVFSSFIIFLYKVLSQF